MDDRQTTQQGQSRQKNKLKALSLRKLEPGMHGDGGGLWLQVSPNGNGRSWIFRYRLNGKAREMGLGSLDAVSLADARGLADENRKLLAAKPPTDPIEHRRALFDAAQATAAKAAAKATTSPVNLVFERHSIRAAISSWLGYCRHSRTWPMSSRSGLPERAFANSCCEYAAG
jgi:hypothetical protein